ncbi:MAG: hypothetical protein L0Y71_01850 [Gemmataceae bacterium]|nr:hypothetical protein [Gemmataceae bacterium]
MTQVVQAKCPFCHNVLRIPADWLSQPMRCKFCKQVIQARTAGATASQAVASGPPPAQAFAPQPEAATAVVAGPPRRSSDPFSFDDDPEPAAVTAPRLPKKGKGMIVATTLLVSLSTIAVLVVVFLGPQLRDLFLGIHSEPVARNNGAGNEGEGNEGEGEPGGNTGQPGGTNNGANTDKVIGSTKKKTPSKGATAGLFPRAALLINVNNYWVLNPVHYGNSPSVGYPGSSTSVLANRLANAPMYFPATRVVELSDSAATPVIPQKSVIEDAIADFCQSARPQDRILILFAGHAVEIEKEAYLIPYEGNQDDAKTLVSLAWVYDQLAKSKARQKIFVLDAFRNPPARGFELPGTGAMTEGFEAKLHSQPPGVQVWTACVKDQESLEFEAGSLFLQCVSNAMQERLGGFADPADPIPVDALAAKVNQRMKDLLSKTKFEQTARLTGKEADGGVAYNPKEPLPPPVVLKSPEAAIGDDKAGAALINNILAEIKQIPPMKASLKAYMNTLRADTLPPFPRKVMDFYRADDYKTWSELETKLKDKDYRAKHPLRAAVFTAKKYLDKAEALSLRETQASPINDAVKKSYLSEQLEIGKLIFDLEEEALYAMNQVAQKRDMEENKRWQAHFDYTLARLQARLIYIHEYNYFLADIRADRLPMLEGDATGWRIGFRPKLSTNESKVRGMFKEVGRLWKKVGEEHPNTPWALLAQRESLYAMGLEWRPSRD